MSEADWILRGAELATGERVDIAVADGRIAGIGPDLALAAAEERDATGLLALPGAVDPHVHFNAPGARSDWEGWDTGSLAAAAGGVTTVVEMPLNASPPTTDVAAFDAKRAHAEANSHVDFGLWGGVIPGNARELEPLAARGVLGFKAFMSRSGSDDFPNADLGTLYDAMRIIAPLGLPLLLHAESDTVTAHLAARAEAEGRRTMSDYIATRPAVAETLAIAEAIELAQATGCPLHIVHISTRRGVELVREASAQGIDVTCEVTAHHLVLSDREAVRIGAAAKCAPPLRDDAEIAALWALLEARAIGAVVSDHSPAPPELKSEGDMLASWGGIAGVQQLVEVMLSDARLNRALAPDVLAGSAARRFRLAGKGALEIGADADIALVELGPERTLEAEELHYRHRQSAYVGWPLRARVRHTFLRGEPAGPGAPPRGRFLAPEPPA